MKQGIAVQNEAQAREAGKDRLEHLRVRSAVDEAVRMGIVREEVFAGPEGSPRHAYLLSSAHYGISDFHPRQTPDHCKYSQHQLFQFAHLLQKSGSQSPIFSEGRTFYKRYNRPMVDILRQRGIDPLDPAMQEEFFRDPGKLLAIWDEQQVIAGQRGISTPCFYEITAYPNIVGAHTPETEKLLKDFVGNWLPWHKAVTDKYQAFTSKFGEKLTSVAVPTGWKQGRPLLQLAEQWFYADGIIHDCENYFLYAQLLEELDTARESDLDNLLSSTREHLIPMGFVGAGHALRMQQRISKWGTAHILTPAASVSQDHLRSPHPVTHPDSKITNVGVFYELHRLAKNVPPLPKQ